MESKPQNQPNLAEIKQQLQIKGKIVSFGFGGNDSSLIISKWS